jgi:hypothetical protein
MLEILSRSGVCLLGEQAQLLGFDIKITYARACVDDQLISCYQL